MQVKASRFSLEYPEEKQPDNIYIWTQWDKILTSNPQNCKIFVML